MPGRSVELVAVMPDGNYLRLNILKAEVTPRVVRVYVAYEDVMTLRETEKTG